MLGEVPPPLAAFVHPHTGMIVWQEAAANVYPSGLGVSGSLLALPNQSSLK